MARLKEALRAAREHEEHHQENEAARLAAVHAALRDWAEQRLPRNVDSLPVEVSEFEASLRRELVKMGLSAPDSASTDADPDDPGFDQVGLNLKKVPELPNMLFVTAMVKIPCGGDEAVFAYRFDSNGRARVIEDHPENGGYGNAKFELSEPDSQGSRLLLIDRWSVQCQSTWMGMTYAVYRLSSSRPAESLVSSKHGFWLGNDGPEFVLKPQGLTIEFLDSSIDSGVHNRSHIFRYDFADGVKRVEPVAFQPQDFAEEWLRRPWGEMQVRSSPKTQSWHAKLHAEYVLGQYTNVVACAARPDRWSIGFELSFMDGKELKEPIAVHLLVRDLGNYRFEMEAVSDSEFKECPGEGEPSDKHPWLSVEQLKALP